MENLERRFEYYMNYSTAWSNEERLKHINEQIEKWSYFKEQVIKKLNKIKQHKKT